MQSLYADGGVVGRNPSPFGGTWAWCLVEDDQLVCEDSGLILPQDGYGHKLTNNVSELFALCSALEAMSEGWRGVVHSDSEVTIGRVFLGWALRGVPPRLVEQLRRVQLRLQFDLRGLRWVLLQGHPTRADLEKGVGVKRGLPVSKWNVYVDKLCQEQARRVQEMQVA